MSGDPHVTSSGCTGSLPGHNFKIKTKRVTWISRDSFFRRQNALSGLHGPSLHPQSALHRSRHHQLKHPLPSIPHHPSTPRLTIAALPLIPNPNRLPKKIISLPSQEAMLSLFPFAYACAIPYPSETILSHLVPSHHKFFLFEKYRIHPCTAHSYTQAVPYSTQCTDVPPTLPRPTTQTQRSPSCPPGNAVERFLATFPQTTPHRTPNLFLHAQT